ncbi:MAG: BrnA antitoxin family protein [Proteobacteria bacterium]|nr:BrnA antitoxin family protein [Pseudomonadota bacterium]
MKKEYDFSRGRRGPVISDRGKTRITIDLDDDVFDHFKAESERTGKGYQTLIEEALAMSVEILHVQIEAME